MKTLTKVGIAFAILGALTLLPGSAKAAADLHVGVTVASSTADLGSSDNPYPTIDAAMAAAVDGDTILIDGTVVTTTSVAVNKAVTIKSGTSGRIETSGANRVLEITVAGVTVDGLQIAKTDKIGVDGLIGIGANDATISNNTFTGQYVIGEGDVVRAMEVYAGASNYNIIGNNISGLRQPAYVNGTGTGTISGNTVSGTKGWVITSNAGAIITGNSFSGNVIDIAIICPSKLSNADTDTCPDSNNYTDISALATANNNAAVENQTPVKANAVLAHVYVNASAAPGGNGTQGAPYQTITAALSRVVATGTISVAAGTYAESVNLAKAVTIVGPNENINPVTGTRGAEAVINGPVFITSGNVTFKGFTVNNVPNTGATIKAIHIYSDNAVLNNVNISNNIIGPMSNASVKGAYGIMVQGVVDGVTIDGNKIDSIASAGWARGIEVTPTGGSTIVPQHVTITNNSIMNVTSGTGDAYDLSSDWASSNSAVADASQITFSRNILNGFKVKSLDTTNSLNVTNNFWGSSTPEFFATSTATGTISYKPWYMDSSLTTLYADPVVTPVKPSSDVAPMTGGGSGGSSFGGGAVLGASISTGDASSTTTSTATTTGAVLGAATGHVFSMSTLAYGMNNAEVLALQQRLAAEGYFKVTPTGFYGPITKAAVKAYQIAKGIRPVTGFVGPITQGALNAQ